MAVSMKRNVIRKQHQQLSKEAICMYQLAKTINSNEENRLTINLINEEVSCKAKI